MIHKCLISENKCQSLSRTTNKFLDWKMILLWHQQVGRRRSVVVVRSPVFMILLSCSFNDDEVALEEVEKKGGAEWFCYLYFNCLDKSNSTSLMLGCVHPHQSWVCCIKKSRNQEIGLSQMSGHAIRDISLWTWRLEVFTGLQGQLMAADSQTGGKMPPWAIFEQKIK